MSSTDDQCWYIRTDKREPEWRCPERAEYSVGNLVDVVHVCPDHLRWAQDHIDSRASDIDGSARADLIHGDEWPSGIPGLWTTTQAARHWGVKPATYRDYVSAGYAPPPVGQRDPTTGAKLHSARASKAAFEARKGQGHRSDLEHA